MEFAFLLSDPHRRGGLRLFLPGAGGGGVPAGTLFPMLIGMSTTPSPGLFAIGFLLRWVGKKDFRPSSTIASALSTASVGRLRRQVRQRLRTLRGRLGTHAASAHVPPPTR